MFELWICIFSVYLLDVLEKVLQVSIRSNILFSL